MMASKTQFIPGRPMLCLDSAAAHHHNLPGADASASPRSKFARSSLRLPGCQEELLSAVRGRNPELPAEDAFVVPAWFPRQKKWFEDPAGSESAVYNYPLLLRLRGPLNERALQQSLQEVVRRHGVLRSVFRIMDQRLLQIVLAQQELSLPVMRLGGGPEAGERQMQEIARAEALRPFDLARDSMLRGQLLRLQEHDHVLQLTTHSLVYDDWSTGVLIRELSEFYGVFAAGTAPLQRELPFQFGDFARWLQQRLQGPALESHLDFWKQQWDSATAFEHLPTDFARPTGNNYTGATQTAILPQAQADSLNMLGARAGVTMFTVLLAGFKCLLYRYSGHEEIGVASCAANRGLAEVEALIGRFGNTMLLRTSLSGNPTFSEVLQRVQAVTWEALAHLELPFGMVLEGLAGGADRKRNRPPQVMFILQNAPKKSWQLPGLSVDWSPLETGTSKLDLIVFLKIEPDWKSLWSTARSCSHPQACASFWRTIRPFWKSWSKIPRNGLTTSLPGTPSERATQTSPHRVTSECLPQAGDFFRRWMNRREIPGLRKRFPFWISRMASTKTLANVCCLTK